MSQRQQPGKAATERRAAFLIPDRIILRQFHRLDRLLQADKRMWHRWCSLFLAAVVLSISPPGHAQGGSRWQIYPVSAGGRGTFAVAVTVSPRGNIWVRQGGDGPASWLDGFQMRTIPFSGTNFFPVYESRSGQIWALFAEGVMEFRRERDQWVQYPVPEIGAEIRSSALRYLHPFPLLPAERDHVLALLPNRLLEYDAGQGRIIVLRTVEETRLGRFNELVEARDGGAWLAGSNGIAKLPAPVRRLTPDSGWLEFLPDPSWRIQNFDRPYEDDESGVSVVADSLSTTGRVVLQLNGQTWQTPIPAPDKARSSWRGLDGILWVLTRNSLFKRERNEWVQVAVPALRGAQYFDVATEPNGVFWLATTDGLVRHALQTWRVPPELADINMPVRSMVEDEDGGLWFAGAVALISLRDGRQQSFLWPPDFQPASASSGPLLISRDGQIVWSGTGGGLMFDPRRQSFSVIDPPEGRRIRTFVGKFRDGRLCAQTVEPGAPGHLRLEIFDGKSFSVFFESNPDWTLGDEVFFLQATEDGALRLGTSLGLGVWDEKAKTFQPVKEFRGNRAVGLLETSKGNIWCTSGEVIYEFNGKTWTAVQTGLGQVNAMREARDGSLWVASSRGLHRFQDGSWIANGAEDGLPSDEVYDVRQDLRGEIWAATAKGVSHYHRAADLDPPLSTIALAENPNEVYSTDVAVLRFHGRDKWDYTPANRLLFSHRLDEGPWSPFLPATSVTFTNPPAGKHHFAVRATDRNWNEEPEPQIYEFASVVPWFREPRVLALAVCGTIIICFLTWLAVNRHLRLVRSYAEVESIVAQRTQELERANQELLHSQKMRALGTLAAGIAHDFNNILSIIKGSTQIIEANLEDKEKIRIRANRIKTMVEQGSGIVKAMLGFSRATAEEKPCDVNQLISETSRLLGDQFGQDVALRLELAPDLPRVRGPAELIQQILLNLVLNAADAMGGRGQIVLNSGAIEQRLPSHLVLVPADAPRFVYISVRDSGSGIAPEILPRIFEPFFTTKSFSTRRGTGLGLSMVYEIAKEMGFGLKVESSPGQGSTFSVILPAWADADA
jgi:signal transduction histidine kinase/ligand-binding sensor domain-containing protein